MTANVLDRACVADENDIQKDTVEGKAFTPVRRVLVGC